MPRTSILNRGQIISQGLEEGSNTAIKTLAETFLNLYLDELYAAFDWPWLIVEETVPVPAGGFIDTTVLSEIYKATRALHIDGQEFEVSEWSEGFFDIRRRIINAQSTSQVGTPLHFHADLNSTKIHLLPVPDKTYSATLWYYHQPAVLTSDTDVPILPSSNLAVMAVANFATRYDRDDLLSIARDNVKNSVVQLRRNMRDYGKQSMDQLQFDRSAHFWRRLD